MPALVLDSSGVYENNYETGFNLIFHYKANKDHPLSINKKQRQFLQLIVRLFADICLCDKTYFLKFSGRCTLCKQGITPKHVLKSFAVNNLQQILVWQLP